MEITKEDLIEFGMKENKGYDKILYPMEKILGEGEEGTIALVITNQHNRSEFAIVLPSGDTLFLVGVKSIEDLKCIERCITSWEPNY